VIVGIGIDLEKVDRFRDLLDRWGARFEEKLFTEAERAYCLGRGKPEQHFAARFAAKEAALKAMGVPRNVGLEWQHFEIVHAESGAPELKLTHAARAAADRLSVVRVHLTLTHTVDTAAAFVVLEA
jgi:holo-[acyl-carrier protein] synthase